MEAEAEHAVLGLPSLTGRACEITMTFIFIWNFVM
jgi:hypothetical protein